MAAGFISFPGILAPSHMLATRTVGARPNIAIIWAQVQTVSPDTTGTSVFQFGFNGSIVTWNDALCDRGTISITTQGHYQVFQIQDRRWRWRRHWIKKAYNVRQSDGSIIAATLASVQQIAADIFSAMDEPFADVSLISSDENPELVLDNSNCVDAIEDLLLQRGYVISLNSDDSVSVYPRGVGEALPFTSELCSFTFTIDPAEIPAALTAVGSQTLVQSKLKMLPVGLDTDGSIKAVASLSYAPSGGWDGVDLNSFDFITDETAKECAKRSVGKWFQVSTQADGTFNLPGYCPDVIDVTSGWQYLPLYPYLASSSVDPFGIERFNPAYVEGVFWDEQLQAPASGNTDKFSRFENNRWTLQGDIGLLIFENPAIKKNSSDTFTFADVYFTCCYAIHDNTSFVKDRYTRSLALGGYGEEQLPLEELQRTIVYNYTSGTSTVSSVTDNSSTLDPLADSFLSSASTKYYTQAGNMLIYRGIVPVNTDGINLQVRWDCALTSPIPFATHVTQYLEGIPLLPTDSERETIRRANMAEDARSRRNRIYHNRLSGTQIG